MIAIPECACTPACSVAELEDAGFELIGLVDEDRVKITLLNNAQLAVAHRTNSSFSSSLEVWAPSWAMYLVGMMYYRTQLGGIEMLNHLVKSKKDEKYRDVLFAELSFLERIPGNLFGSFRERCSQLLEPSAILGRMTKTLLIVEDVKIVSAAYKRLLSSLDLKVLIATSAEEALEILVSMPVDLVITDLSLPKMSGEDFRRVCQTVHPDLPIALITGYPEEYVSKEGFVGVATKPIEKFADFVLGLFKTIEQEKLDS